MFVGQKSQEIIPSALLNSITVPCRQMFGFLHFLFFIIFDFDSRLVCIVSKAFRDAIWFAVLQ